MSPDEEYRVYCDLAWADLSERLRDMRRRGASLEDALWAFHPPSVPWAFEGSLADMNLWLTALLEEHEVAQLPIELPKPVQRQRPDAAVNSAATTPPVTTAPIDRWF